MRNIGARGVRLEISWSAVERVRGKYDWAQTDSILDELRAAGLRAYALIDFTPSWARPTGTTDHYRPVINGSTKAGDEAFGAFAAAAARRYGDRLEGWEIWNEPNAQAFWVNCLPGRPAAAVDYLALYKAASDSLKATLASARVITGGLASFGGRSNRHHDSCGSAASITDLPAHEFLHQLLTAGLRPQVVGIHPYSGLPPLHARVGERAAVFPGIVVDSVTAQLDKAGFARVPLWVTEWGVDQRRWRDPAFSAQWVENGLRILKCNRRVELITLYVLRDQSSSYDYSLVDEALAPTGAGKGLERYLQSPPNCT